MSSFLKMTYYIFWGMLIVVLVVAALNGEWILMAVAAAIIGWRIGVRALVRWNQREVEAWTARGRGDNSD